MPRIVPSQIVGYIDARYRQAKEQISGRSPWYLGQDHTAQISHLLSMLEQLPEHLVTLSGEAAAEFGEAKEALRVAVTRWSEGDKAYVLNHLPAHAGLNPLTVLRKHLATLSDEGVEATTNPLSFIKDLGFRQSVRRDLASIDRLLLGQEWKAATVLAGSVIETLLLNAITEHESMNAGLVKNATQQLVKAGTLPKTPPLDLNSWNLQQMTEVAFHLTLIDKETATQCSLGRDFRNLIHPGKSVRTAQACNRATALSAVAGVAHCLDDLTS